MIILGLTGTIGSGKSMVSRLFRRANVPVFDADACVHALLGPQGAAVPSVLDVFGAIGSVARGVDRKQLGQVVFGASEELTQLERILHPLVRDARQAFLQKQSHHTRLVVFDIPLLFETGADVECDLTAVVHAPRYIRHVRVQRRDGLLPVEIEAREARQLPDHAKLRYADIIIQNGLSYTHTQRQALCILQDLRVR